MRCLPALALLLVGCAGGQTGEITMLGACREDIGEAELAEVSAALDRVGRERATTVTWSDPSFATGDAELTVELTERGPARLIGGQGCDRPHVSAGANATIRTDDGSLDVSLDGTLARLDPQLVVVHLRGPTRDNRGGGALPADGELRIELSLTPEQMSGSALYEPMDELEDQTVLATF